MFESLINLDKSLLLWINSFNSPFFDHFFYITTNLVAWLPLAVVLLFCLYRRMGTQPFLWYVAFLVVVVIMADQLASDIIKPLVERPRPTHDPDLENLVHVVNGYRGGPFGFVSSHAANSFAVATFLALTLRKPQLSCTAFAWAILSSYSRMYLAVHYPGDILCGALLGALIAWGAYTTIKRVQPALIGISRTLTETDQHLFTTAFLLTIAVASLFHLPLYSAMIS